MCGCSSFEGISTLKTPIHLTEPTVKFACTTRGDVRNKAVENLEMPRRKFLERLASHKTGGKDGCYFLRGIVKEGGKARGGDMAAVTLAVIDGDKRIDPETGEIAEGAPPYDAALNAVKAMGHPAVLHTSHSHGSGKGERWRIVFPLPFALEGSAGDMKAGLVVINQHLIETLHKQGCLVAYAGEIDKLPQPWFFSRVDPSRKGTERGDVIAGNTEIPVERLLAEAAEDQARAAAPKAPERGTQPGRAGLLAGYNAKHGSLEGIRERLDAHGYVFDGSAEINGEESHRYLAPGSTSQEPGVRVFKHENGQKYVVSSSHGKHDPLSAENNEGKTTLDAFDLFRILEHGGDKQAAIDAARAELFFEVAGVDSGERLEPTALRRVLDFTENGRIKPHLNNLCLILSRDAQMPLIRKNLLSSETMYGERPLVDTDVTKTRRLIHQRYGFEPSRAQTADALRLVAEENGFDPVRDYADSCQWDGIPRLSDFLHDFAGAADDEYTRTVARILFISLLARTYHPGCKADQVVVLEGEQGCGKSTLCASLVPNEDWFADPALQLHGKDADKANGELISRLVVVEMGELAGLRSGDSRYIKTFLSKQSDYFRAPYATCPETWPRRCIFIGTTNESEYLADPTGGRRFLPVRVGQIDIPGFLAVRDQLWAEARHAYENGEKWFVPSGVVSPLSARFAEEQEKRRTVDPWEESVRGYLAGRDRTTTKDLFQDALGITTKEQNPANRRRLCNILRNLDWRKMTIDEGGKKVSGWRPKDLERWAERQGETRAA
jgi:predicted P-loop ATPase